MIEAIEMTFVVPDGDATSPKEHRDALRQLAIDRGLEVMLDRLRQTDRTKLSWMVFEMRTHVSILPNYEDAHVIGVDCWCQPKITHDEGYEVPLVVHRDIAERDSGVALTDGSNDD